MFVHRTISPLWTGLFTLAVLLATPLASKAAPPTLTWMSNIEAAKRVAVAHKKLILVHFYSPNDSVSQQMDQHVFSDAALTAMIQQAYVPVRIDVQSSPLERQKYRIRRWPTELVLTASGDEIFRGRNLTSAVDMLALLGSLRQGQTAVATVPPAIFQNTTPHIVPAQFQQRSSNLVPVPLPELQPPVVDYGVPMAVEIMAEVPASASQLVQLTGLPASEPAVTATAEPQPLRTSHRHQAELATVRWITPQRSTNNEDTRHQARTELNTQIFRRDPRLQVPSKPKPPKQTTASLPQLGLDGFCPVSLRGDAQQQGSWVAGDRQHGVVHRERLYLFAGSRERDLFLRNPDLYSPVISGYDPVILADHRQLASGRRDYGVVFQGRIYLFSSSATMQQFWRAARQYAAVADNAMKQAR